MPLFDITLPKPLSFVKTLGAGTTKNGKTNKTSATYTYAYIKDKDSEPSANEFGFRSNFTTKLAQTFGGLEKPRGRPRHRASVCEQPTSTPAELRKVLSSPCLHPEHEPLVHEEEHVATERSVSPPPSDTSSDDTAVPSEGDSTPVNSLSRSPSYKKDQDGKPELIDEELLNHHLQREPCAPLPDEREYAGVSLVHKLSTPPAEFYNPAASGFPAFVPFRGAFTCEDDEGPL